MTLISIRLALREGESENIRVQDFSRELSVVNSSGDVKSLAVTVKVNFQKEYTLYIMI
jgi:hypothetical protein